MKIKDILIVSSIVASVMFVMLYLYDANRNRIAREQADALEAPVIEVVPETTLKAEEIADRVLRATVTINSYDRYGNINGTGSGFFASGSRFVLAQGA